MRSFRLGLRALAMMTAAAASLGVAAPPGPAPKWRKRRTPNRASRRARMTNSPYQSVRDNPGRLTRAGRRGYVTPVPVKSPASYLNAHARRRLAAALAGRHRNGDRAVTRFLALAFAAFLSTCVAAPAFAEPRCVAGADGRVTIGKVDELRAAMARNDIDPTEIVKPEHIAAFMAAIRAHIPVADEPDRIMVVAEDGIGRVFLIVGPDVCNLVKGPSAGIRALVKQILGEGA